MCRSIQFIKEFQYFIAIPQIKNNEIFKKRFTVKDSKLFNTLGNILKNMAQLIYISKPFKYTVEWEPNDLICQFEINSKFESVKEQSEFGQIH